MKDLISSFRLPTQRRPDPDDPDLSPHAVQAWVERLPLANGSMTARALLKALYHTNRLLYPWSARLGFLSTLMPPLADADAWLRGRFTAETFPLRPRARLTAELAFELQREAGLGFLIVAEELLDRGTLSRHRDALARAMAGAVTRLSKALLVAFQARIPGAAEVWGPLHAIYLLAVRHELAGHAPDRSSPSIADLYKRALLLAAADPNRLRPLEINDLWKLLRDHASLATLAAEMEPGAPGFAVNPHEGSGPVPLLRATASDDWLQLGIGPLCDYWEGEKQQLPRVVASTLHHWAEMAQRRADRQPGDGEVDLLVGLTHIHERLREADPESAVAAEGLFAPAQFTAAPSKALLRRLEDPFIRALGNVGPAAALQPRPREVVLDLGGAEAWHVDDSADRGLRISHPIDPPPETGLHAGEIAGVFGTSTLELVPAIVRWVRIEAGRIEAGLELLPGRAQAVAVKREAGAHQRALLCREGGTETLVVYSGLFSTGQELELLRADREERIVLGGLSEAGTAYSRFRFAPLPPMTLAAGPDDLDRRFAELWGT